MSAADLNEIIASVRRRIEARDGDLGAWTALDWDAVERQRARLEALAPERRGPLHGMPIGVKDVYDTADFPTSYGSAIYAGHRPPADSGAVARLKAAGAIVIGKTVSTELAFWQAGRTVNPRDPARSPGGSSSGSAAAVADGHVPVALGSQTAASTIRPAAYCGVVGFKPTRGRVSLAGVKALAGSLDTAGLIACSVEDAARVGSVLAGIPWAEDMARHLADPAWRPSLRVIALPELDAVSPVAMAAVDIAATALGRAGADVMRATAPHPFDELCPAQITIMGFEMARDLAFEASAHRERLSGTLIAALDEGAAVSWRAYLAALALRDAAIADLASLFADSDVLLAPSAVDEAPLLADGTGNPVCSRTFTLLGLPSVTVPCGTGPADLPLGLQIVGRPGADALTLAVAAWASARL